MPSKPALMTRVDAVPAAQRCSYYANYYVAIQHHSSQRLCFGSYSHAGGVNLSQLDRLYYSRCNITNFFRAPSTPSLLRKKAQQYLIEIIGWSFLRGAENRQILSLLQKNGNKTCRAVFDRAMSFLLPHASQLNNIQGMDEKLVTVVIEGSMRILCDLQGVGVREASAVVAAWTPVGIFMSDELVKNLLGAEVKCENTWELWNLFYKEALIALKKGQFGSGREMEKVAWSMMHPAPHTAPIERVASTEIKPEDSPMVLTSAAAKTSLVTAAPISTLKTAKDTPPCLNMLQKKSKKQRRKEAKEQKAKERQSKIEANRAASISTVARASRNLDQQIVHTSAASTDKSHQQNKKLGKKEREEQRLKNSIDYNSGAGLEVITISDDEPDQPITTAPREMSKKQSNKRKRSSDCYAPSPAYSEFSTGSSGWLSSSSNSTVSLGTPQWVYEAEKKQRKMLEERRKRRKSTADWIEEAKKAAAERNEDADGDGRRRSKRIKALREQAYPSPAK